MKGCHGLVSCVFRDIGLEFLEERHDAATAIGHQLAAHQIERLNAVGTLIDHGDAGVAHELGGSGFLDETMAAKHLLRHHGIIEADVGEMPFENRREEAKAVFCLLACLLIRVLVGNVGLDGGI